MIIPDAHTHIDYIDRLNPDAHAVVNSVIEDDWLKVAQLCHERLGLIPALGLHPWYLTAQLCHNTEWRTRLDNLLSTVPNVTVGEVGLDRSTIVPLSVQTEILEMQLESAKQHNCAVSIHCFKAFDILIPIIRRYNLTYILHGYSGSVEITKQLLDMNCYFSFGMIQPNRLNKLSTIVSLIPKERLLVESDGKAEADLTTTAKLLEVEAAQLCENFKKAISPRKDAGRFIGTRKF